MTGKFTKHCFPISCHREADTCAQGQARKQKGPTSCTTVLGTLQGQSTVDVQILGRYLLRALATLQFLLIGTFTATAEVPLTCLSTLLCHLLPCKAIF
jgi:hypothetical protein